MIKKAIIALCVISLAAFSVIGVSAACDYELNNPDTVGYSSITYDNPSNYSVVIPDTIDGNANEITLTATNMNLHANETVEVTAGNDIVDLTSAETDDIAKYNFGSNNGVIASFNNGDLISKTTIYPYVENANQIAAAHYTGDVTFRVRLVTSE